MWRFSSRDGWAGSWAQRWPKTVPKPKKKLKYFILPYFLQGPTERPRKGSHLVHHLAVLKIIFPQTGSQPVGFLLLVNDWLIVFRQIPLHGARLPACPPACLPACPPARLPACPPARLPGARLPAKLFHGARCPVPGARLPACPANPLCE